MSPSILFSAVSFFKLFLQPTLSVHITAGPFLWNGHKTQLLFDVHSNNLILFIINIWRTQIGCKDVKGFLEVFDEMKFKEIFSWCPGAANPGVKQIVIQMSMKTWKCYLKLKTKSSLSFLPKRGTFLNTSCWTCRQWGQIVFRSDISCINFPIIVQFWETDLIPTRNFMVTVWRMLIKFNAIREVVQKKLLF